MSFFLIGIPPFVLSTDFQLGENLWHQGTKWEATLDFLTTKLNEKKTEAYENLPPATLKEICDSFKYNHEL